MKIEFVKFQIEKPVEGIIQGFGKNKFGIFLILKSDKKMLGVNLKPAVLRNLVKANITLFIKGNKINITKFEKPKGKTYYNYQIKINDKVLESRSFDIDIDEVANLL